MTDDLIDSEQAAAILQVSARRQVPALVRKAGVKYRRVGRFYLFYRSEIEKLATDRGGKRGRGKPASRASLVKNNA